MKSATYRRLVPFVCLLFMSGLLLTSVSLLPDKTAPSKAPAKSSPKIYGLVDIGKWVKSRAHEQFREDVREFYSITEHPWIILRFSPAAKLNVVRAQKDPQAWLRKNLHADYLGKTDILRIWLTDGSPHEQAVIIDTILSDEVEGIQRDRSSSLKAEIARSRRYIAMDAQEIIILEADLRKLVSVLAFNMSELEALWTRLSNLVRQIAAATKRVTIHRARIEDDEALLRTLPRIVKWAGKARPEE